MRLLNIWILKLFISASLQHKSDNLFNIFGISDRLSKIMIYIIQNCYDKNGTIVLSGDLSDKTYGLKQIFSSAFPVTLVGLYENVHYLRHRRLKNVFEMNETVLSKKKYPRRSFIIMTSSNDTLFAAFSMLKDSVMWNHEGFFFIVYNNDEKHCSDASSVLHTAWSFHILSATVLCNDFRNDLQLYTFNPYTQYAPTIWNCIETEKETYGNWTLYQLPVNNLLQKSTSTLCRNLNFDKTQQLGGYTIPMGASVHPPRLTYDERKTGLLRFGGVDGNIARTVWPHLNVVPLVHFYESPGYIDNNGSLQSILKDLVSRKIDVSMNLNLLRDFWRLQTYPQGTASFCMVSRKNLTSNHDHFQGILSSRGWMLCGVTVVVLTIFFKFLLNRGSSYAALEVVKMIVSLPAASLPMSFACNMLFAFFALLMMLLCAMLQSRLTSMDVVPSTAPTIDTEADLVKSKLDIYGPLTYYELLSHLEVRDRYRQEEFKVCLDMLVNGSQFICIGNCYEAEFKASAEIHVAREFRMFHTSFSTVEDWPLITRFNKVMRRLNEAGLMSLFRRRQADGFKRIVENKDNDMKGIVEKNMKLNWRLWFGGMSLSTITFFVEIYFHRAKKRAHILHDTRCRSKFKNHPSIPVAIYSNRKRKISERFPAV